MILRFVRWARRLLHPGPTLPQEAARPDARVMHLLANEFRPACPARPGPNVWLTVETKMVNCPDCKKIIRRRRVRHLTSVR